MASTPKQVNGNGTNSSLGKRKKSRGKSTYLSRWLDKTMHHMQDVTPNTDMYEFFSPSTPGGGWTAGGSQFTPGYDPYGHIYTGHEPMSLPTLPSYHHSLPMATVYGPEHRYLQNVNHCHQTHRPRPRRRNEHKPEEVHSSPNCLSNDPDLSKNLLDGQDYSSLPPIITSVGDTNSNCDLLDKDKDDGNNRRYSDPCVRGLPDVARPANGEIDSDSDTGSGTNGSQIGSRLLSFLLDQVTSLRLANERLNKDLMDTRAELETIRHHNVMLHKGSTSSMGATPNHSLDNGQYSPGFLTDLVREIRDAARIREEAMYTRVRAMVLERSENLASTEAKLTEKSLDEIKSNLRASEADRRRMMDRINKLEDEVLALRVTSGLETNDNKITNGNVEDPDTERLRLRKELNETRKAKQYAEEHSLKLERLVTQLRSKFNGHHLTNGPDSLPSEPEHEPNARVRRASVNSSNSTVVFGPVTDL